MNNKPTIIVDTYGSDKGAEEIIIGVSMLLNAHENIHATLVGDENLIDKTLKENGISKERYSIIQASGTITNLDKIMEAFYSKTDSSLILACQELARDEEAIGMLTAGNSGAILVSALKYLPSKNLTRPCMASILPAAKGGYTCLLDTGATIDCTVSQLHEFAHLGSDFYKKLYKVDNPTVGLVSNGAEPTKGNKLVKEAFKILSEDKTINFIGNAEGNNCLSGDFNVIVCDGFIGNQVLKVTEGTAARIIKDIVVYSKKNNKPEYMELVNYLMKTYDLSSLGGAIVLGAKKTIIKCRGNSGRNAILNTGEILINLTEDKTFFEGKDERIF